MDVRVTRPGLCMACVVQMRPAAWGPVIHAAGPGLALPGQSGFETAIPVTGHEGRYRAAPAFQAPARRAVAPAGPAGLAGPVAPVAPVGLAGPVGLVGLVGLARRGILARGILAALMARMRRPSGPGIHSVSPIPGSVISPAPPEKSSALQTFVQKVPRQDHGDTAGRRRSQDPFNSCKDGIP
jgi:hypothetical protein